MDTFFWLYVVSGALLIVIALLPSFVPIREQRPDGQRGISRAGQILIGIAILSWLCSVTLARVQDQKNARSQSRAEAIARAETDSIISRISSVLAELRTIRDEAEASKQMQHLTLARTDSAVVTAVELAVQQQQTTAALATTLQVSRSISDSLQAGMIVSRQIADTLRWIEENARGRSSLTLAMLDRSSNPLTSIRSEWHLRIPRNDETRELLDRLYSARKQYRPSHPSARRRYALTFSPVEVSGRWVVIRTRRTEPIFLPAGVTLDFWRGDAECLHPSEHMFSARRMLDFRVLDAVFVRGSLGLTWGEAEFEISAPINIAVDDLRDACVSAGFYGDPISSLDPVWRSVELGQLNLNLPQGREGIVEFRSANEGSYGIPISWTGRMRFD